VIRGNVILRLLDVEKGFRERSFGGLFLLLVSSLLFKKLTGRSGRGQTIVN